MSQQLIYACRWADLLLLNKIDMLDPAQLPALKQMMLSLNTLAGVGSCPAAGPGSFAFPCNSKSMRSCTQVIPCAHGAIDVSDLLSVVSTARATRLSLGEQHRAAVAAARPRHVHDCHHCAGEQVTALS